ncbi:MAG: hypothetical protein FRX49_03529 [Trebouxia sp. A1-2]|nr:MAG: hypothetical protein FRX49_03529 [Trebouxia sp. A1-2]
MSHPTLSFCHAAIISIPTGMAGIPNSIPIGLISMPVDASTGSGSKLCVMSNIDGTNLEWLTRRSKMCDAMAETSGLVTNERRQQPPQKFDGSWAVQLELEDSCSKGPDRGGKAAERAQAPVLIRQLCQTVSHEAINICGQLVNQPLRLHGPVKLRITGYM